MYASFNGSAPLVRIEELKEKQKLTGVVMKIPIPLGVSRRMSLPADSQLRNPVSLQFHQGTVLYLNGLVGGARQRYPKREWQRVLANFSLVCWCRPDGRRISAAIIGPCPVANVTV